MPKEENVRALLTDNLGKEVGDAILAKIDKMVKEGATPARIERAVQADIATEIEKQVLSAIVVNIGPIQPIKVKPIQSAIKPAIKPIPSIRISTGLSVRIGPPSFTKGTK